MLTLDILIATYKLAGIERVATTVLPEIDGVRYLINWQCHDDAPVPESLRRGDVVVMRSDSAGLSNNRNEALKNATADLVMIADDDISFSREGIVELIKTYESNPDIDLITFKSVREDASCYPSQSTRLYNPLPKNYYVASIELSFRRRCRLKFCPEFGLNSLRMHGGEDELLLQSALHKSLNCWFFPIVIARHDHYSTGSKQSLSCKNLRASGCVIALIYGRRAVLRIPLKAWRVARARQSNFAKALYYLLQGAVRAHKVRRRNPDSLW